LIRSRRLDGNIMAGLRSTVGGEIDEYTQLLEEARRHAVDRLVRRAWANSPDQLWHVAVLSFGFSLGGRRKSLARR
jgi:uncharacterized protein YbjQ (UPF0145 family)